MHPTNKCVKHRVLLTSSCRVLRVVSFPLALESAPQVQQPRSSVRYSRSLSLSEYKNVSDFPLLCQSGWTLARSSL